MNNIKEIKNIEDSFTDVLQVEGVNAKGFGTIPKLVMQDLRLTHQAKCIYSYFCTYAGAGKQAFPSIKLILHHLGFSKSTYYKHFDLLKKYGYIKVTQSKINGKFSKNIYTLCTNPVEVEEEQINDKTSENTENLPCPKNEYSIENKDDLPCPNFQYTENRDTKNAYTENWDSNNNSSNNNNIYNNQSIHQSNNRIVMSETKEFKNNDRKIDISNNDKELYLKVLENCCIEGLKESYRIAVSKIIQDFFWDIENKKNRVQIGDNSIPKKIFKNEVSKLNYFIIEHAINKFEQASKEAEIKNPTAYLRSCIYNAISQMHLEVQSDCMRLKLV